MADLSNSIHVVNGYDKDAYTYCPILIVGAGASGIALGCRLKERLGFDQFRMFDRQSGVGGTWWINRYPGVACDVPAIFYSFSFSMNYKWSSFYPSGSEIIRYLQHVCGKYGIVDNIQLNIDVSEVRWLEDEELWEATLLHMVPGVGDLSNKDRQTMIAERGPESVYLLKEKVKAKIICSAVGAFVEPNTWSDISRRDQFEGNIFHSSRWDYNIDLHDKDVIVLGTGCSAAQFVPRLSKEPYNVKSVTQIMRSPPWVVPRASPPLSSIFEPEIRDKWIPRLFSIIPRLGRVYRTLLFFLMEFEFFFFFPNTDFAVKSRKNQEAYLLRYMKRVVPNHYHDILEPDYSFGCKRRVFDAYWLESLNDPKINLTNRSLTSLHPRGVTLGPDHFYSSPEDKVINKTSTDEKRLPADVIILANGFNLTTWLSPLKVIGKGDIVMQKVWDERGGAQAYMGNAMDGFPNFFIIYGPNTATGHTSVILTSENMVEYTLRFIEKILRKDVKTFEVKKEKEIAWTKEMQEKLKGMVWNTGGCRSWYQMANGWNAIAYPYSQIDFSLRCMFPKWSDWNIQYTTKGLIKQRIKQTLRILILLASIVGLYHIRRDVRGGLGAFGSTVKRMVKLGLLRLLELVEKRVRLLV